MAAPSLPVTAATLAMPIADQIRAFESVEFPQPFLRQTLFPNEHIFRSVAIQVIYNRLSRRLAPFVNLYQTGRILEGPPQTWQAITLPAFAPTRVLRSDDALAPPPSCGFVSPNATDWIGQIMATNLRDLELSLSTREEWLCSQLLQFGRVEIVGDDPSDPAGHLTLNFEINEPVSLSGSAAWNADPPPDIIAWLQSQCRALAQKSGVRPDTLILGAEASAAFLANPAVMRERTLLANIQDTAPEVEDSSVMFLGRFAALDCFEYDGIFLESVLGEDGKYTDQVRDMIDPRSAILCSQAIPGSMCFGAISITEDRAIQVYAAKRVPQSWADRENGLWRQRLSSRFCPVPSDSASWQIFASVLTAPAIEAGSTHGPAKNAKK